ncbi:unnamed protein product [Adineta ricciae]|nr:unnamed protein product [Adineta ricciae]
MYCTVRRPVSSDKDDSNFFPRLAATLPNPVDAGLSKTSYWDSPVAVQASGVSWQVAAQSGVVETEGVHGERAVIDGTVSDKMFPLNICRISI